MNKSPSVYFLAGALAAACAGPAFADAPSPAQTPTPDHATVAAAPSFDGSLPYAVVEDTWIYLIDEPGIYLDQARADLRRGMFTRAATDVRKAAAMIDADATRADAPNRARLKQNVGALLQVAAGIDAGRVTDGERLDIAIAKARTDLAVHHD